MLEIALFPDLSHCIETVARNEYREALGRLLASGEGGEELKEKVELLRMFLETMDFRQLRKESEEHLVGGREVKFVIYLEGGRPKYDIRVG